MKRSHMLVAALSLGGTLAAVSATHAAAFDPVPATGSMGAPGAAESVPRDGYIYLQAGDVVVPVYIGNPRRMLGGSAVRPEAVEAMLDLDASRSGR